MLTLANSMTIAARGFSICCYYFLVRNVFPLFPRVKIDILPSRLTRGHPTDGREFKIAFSGFISEHISSPVDTVKNHYRYQNAAVLFENYDLRLNTGCESHAARFVQPKNGVRFGKRFPQKRKQAITWISVARAYLDFLFGEGVEIFFPNKVLQFLTR